MENPKWLLYWRLSATSTLARKHFFALGLPPVNTPDYKSYSELLPQGQGGQTRQGYKNVALLWNEMDFVQFRTLTRIVEAAILAGSIYATIDKADGTGLVNSFIDCHGVAFPLEYTPVSDARGVVYQNVTLRINAIVVDSDPSALV